VSALLEIHNSLGMTISVAVDDVRDAYVKMRQYGASGWMSGEIPAGGIQLPYAMHDRFDWRLIGARRFTKKIEDGEIEMVEHNGSVYTRRDFPAEPKKKLPAVVKYSRGARPIDENKEGADDAFAQYVTLVVFKGGGPLIDEFCKPSTTSQQTSGAAAPTSEVKEMPPAPLQRQLAIINTQSLARSISIDSDQMIELIKKASQHNARTLAHLTASDADELIALLCALPLPQAQPQEPKPIDIGAAREMAKTSMGYAGELTTEQLAAVKRALNVFHGSNKKLGEFTTQELVAFASRPIEAIA